MEPQVTPTNGAVKSVAKKSQMIIAERYSTTASHPFGLVKWKTVTATIKGSDGATVFEQKDVEAPEFWSQRAINIVAEKYFRVINGVKENSVKQLITRVARTIARAGMQQQLLTEEVAVTLELELTHLLLHQKFAFNSPVWFNIGVPGVPQQASACFINAVEDTMDSITELARTEVLLFKGGSGAGSNMSKIRSSYETLSGGGSPSGPVSFMKMLDAGAGVTKSGGTTRRAAKMAVLNVDHPDILQQANGEPGFITCKAHAETIAQALINAGFSAEFNKPGNAYDLVPFQNANNSVRVTDYFMRKVQDNETHETKARTTGAVVHKYQAQMVWNEIAKAAWASGDPGLQFDTTTNKWHTLPNTGRINSSNPCSEYLHLDDTSCNLGSFNLMQFIDDRGDFQVDEFVHATEVCITAMEILCGYASYPTLSIEKHTQASRPLGIGYANLGTALMVKGLAYDSTEGRAFAAGVTSLMTAVAYRQSALMAQVVGPFDYYKANEKEMLEVIEMHYAEAHKLQGTLSATAATKIWAEALKLGRYVGYRNSQVSVLAPTGTIAFMMDCDTTGVEPMLALIQNKKLVGGGTINIPNRAVERALKNLGYSSLTVMGVLSSMEKTGQITGIKAKDASVFQTAIGADQVSVEGHLLMMSAIQPFLSGGISKTVNMPHSATVEDVANTYMRAWELGLKCVAIYRDGCKASQPTSAVGSKKEEPTRKVEPRWGERKRLPDERKSITHKFSIGGQDGYFHVGLHNDGTPGEVFINISKAGSTLHGLTDMVATAISVGLQHGVPLNTFIDKFRGMRFEPSGFTPNKGIPRTDSIADYFARWMELREAPPQLQEKLPLETKDNSTHKVNDVSYHGDPCKACGNITVRSGACWVCPTCGTTTGCG